MLKSGLLAGVLGIIGFSGLARPPKSAKTSSAPVVVDFRDIAVQAGLTALNASGDPEKKRYILETTGDGVGIFEYDNDGLMGDAGQVQ
jgi:hypothetical protein